jgi:hypothetical protein
MRNLPNISLVVNITFTRAFPVPAAVKEVF